MNAAETLMTARVILSLPDSAIVLYSVGVLHGSCVGILQPDPLLVNFRGYRDGWEDGLRLIPSLGDPPAV